MLRQITRKQRRMRIGLRQKAALIGLVEQNFQFTSGKHPTASNKNARWRNIALSLNKIGPVIKTTDEWRAAFNGMKGKLKEKIKRIRDSNITARLSDQDEEDSKASNPDSSDAVRLTKEDYRIIKLCRIKGLNELEQIDGNISTPANSTTSYTERKSTPAFLASIKSSPTASTSSKRTRKKVIPFANKFLSQDKSSPMALNITTSIPQINDSADQYLSQGRSSPMASNINTSIPKINDSADQYLSHLRISPMASNINTSIPQINESGNEIRRQIYSENPAVAKSLRLQEENNRNQLIMITVLKQIVDKQQIIIDLMQKQ